MTESLIDKFRTFPDNDGCDTITCKEKYKQQILENAEIVERLKEEIKLWNKIKPDSLFFIKELQSILGETQ